MCPVAFVSLTAIPLRAESPDVSGEEETSKDFNEEGKYFDYDFDEVRRRRQRSELVVDDRSLNRNPALLWTITVEYSMIFDDIRRIRRDSNIANIPHP